MLLRKDTINDFNNSFKVFARVRPLNDQQLKYSGQKQLYTFDDNQIVIKTRIPEQSFKFDRIYGPSTFQSEIFDAVADQVIDKAFQGINGTIFCYGQTSSGKTHTIIGDYESKKLNDEGLLPRILREVIQKKNTLIDNVKQSNLDIRIKMSMIEIYNQKVIDLFDLSKKNLRLRENKKQGVFIEQVTQKYIVSTEEAMKFVYIGLQNRTAGRTNENTFSSRSHMVFTITIVETDFDKKEAKSARITLTDLAGSQRLSKTGVVVVVDNPTFTGRQLIYIDLFKSFSFIVLLVGSLVQVSS